MAGYRIQLQTANINSKKSIKQYKSLCGLEIVSHSQSDSDFLMTPNGEYYNKIFSLSCLTRFRLDCCRSWPNKIKLLFFSTCIHFGEYP